MEVESILSPLTNQLILSGKVLCSEAEGTVNSPMLRKYYMTVLIKFIWIRMGSCEHGNQP